MASAYNTDYEDHQKTKESILNDLQFSVSSEVDDSEPYKNQIMMKLTEIEMRITDDSTNSLQSCISSLTEIAAFLQDKYPQISQQAVFLQSLLFERPKENTKQIVLIGETGSGKSTLGNIFLGVEKEFKTSSDLDSCTDTIQAIRGKWLGNGEEVLVVDCPGLNDSFNRDAQHLDALITDLKKLGYISAFILLFNSQQSRLTKAHYDMIDIFRGIFGISIFENMLIVLTRWPMDSESRRRRHLADETSEKKTKDYNQKLRKEWKVHNRVPCYFLDCMEHLHNLGRSPHQNTLDAMSSHIQTLQPYHTVKLDQLKSKQSKLKNKVSKARGFVDFIGNQLQTWGLGSTAGDSSAYQEPHGRDIQMQQLQEQMAKIQKQQAQEKEAADKEIRDLREYIAKQESLSANTRKDQEIQDLRTYISNLQQQQASSKKDQGIEQLREEIRQLQLQKQSNESKEVQSLKDSVNALTRALEEERAITKKRLDLLGKNTAEIQNVRDSVTTQENIDNNLGIWGTITSIVDKVVPFGLGKIAKGAAKVFAPITKTIGKFFGF